MSILQYETIDEKGKKIKKWKVDFYVDGVRERRRDFNTKKEAFEYQMEFTLKKKGSSQMSFKSLVETYLEHCEARDKKTTNRSKASVIKKWFDVPEFDKPVAEITTKDISDWQNKLLSGKIRPSTCRVINSYMNSLFDYAVKFLDFSKNPVPELKLEIENNEKEIITFEQLKILLENEKKEIYKHIMIILFWTGIRKGELLALKFEDFDLKKKTLRINKSMDSQSKEVSTPKTKNSVRTITINKAVIKSVERLYEMMYDKDRPIFIDLASATLLAHVKALGARCGIDHLTIHTFRHSHASFLFEKGVNILLVSKRLGHASVSTTLNTYTHVMDSMLKELTHALEVEEGFDHELPEKNKNDAI